MGRSMSSRAGLMCVRTRGMSGSAVLRLIGGWRTWMGTGVRCRCGAWIRRGISLACREHPGLMLPRRIEDEGPFYSMYPEGTIQNFDGFTVPGYDYLSDNAVDMNRNFPYEWAPEPKQKGAGISATSEPESRAVVEF